MVISMDGATLSNEAYQTVAVLDYQEGAVNYYKRPY